MPECPPPPPLQLGTLEAENVKETTRAIRGRVREEFARRVDLDDAALVHEDDPVGDRAGEAHLVGDDEHGHAGASELENDVEDLAHHFRIEGGGDLVEEEDLGGHHEGAHDGDALALAAGELARVVVGAVRQADALEQFQRPRARVGARFSGDEAGGERQVPHDGEVGEELVRLEDHADAAANLGPGDAGRGQVGPVEEDLPGVDGFEAVNGAQERGLAAAGGPDDDDDFTVGDVEGDTAQGVVSAGVGLVEVDEAQLRVGGQFCQVFSMWRERSEMGQQMRKYSAKIRP